MIIFNNKNNEKPYQKFFNFYDQALKNHQKNPEVISISSYSPKFSEVSCRYVNLKYINDDEWIFFSNYRSKKSEDFNAHPQIAVTIFWDAINIQIRLKAIIKKTETEISDIHFLDRSKQKNALAISSNQSSLISSYNKVIERYENQLNKKNNNQRPKHWGGYSFKPYYFEFWEGHDSRVNKRTVFAHEKSSWRKFTLQP